MQARKAVRVINALIADKRGSLVQVERRRWPEQMKEQARKLLREDIAALGLARDVLKNHSAACCPHCGSDYKDHNCP